MRVRKGTTGTYDINTIVCINYTHAPITALYSGVGWNTNSGMVVLAGYTPDLSREVVCCSISNQKTRRCPIHACNFLYVSIPMNVTPLIIVYIRIYPVVLILPKKLLTINVYYVLR